jgi:hypothetical protein
MALGVEHGTKSTEQDPELGEDKGRRDRQGYAEGR